MGRRRAKPGPTRMRAMCGTISPTQPIWPEIATTAAVTRVAAATTIRRRRPASTPSALASSSPSASTSMRQRSRSRGARPSSTAGRAPREVACGGAGEAAQQPEGDRRQLVVGVGQDLEQRDHRAGERADDHAGQHQDQHRLAAAHGGGHQIDQGHGGEAAGEGQQLDAETGRERKMPSTAPRPAPADTPRMSGETSGLRNRFW